MSYVYIDDRVYVNALNKYFGNANNHCHFVVEGFSPKIYK